MDDVERLSQDKVEQYDVLHAPPSADLQALVDLAAQVAGAPMAAINLLTSTEQHMIATSGIGPSVCAREDSMCAVVATDPGPVVVPDATVDDRFSSNPFVTGVLDRFRFYASAPLVAPDGVPVGRLCVFDHQPRELDQRQQETLVVLADRVMDVLELRLRTRQLEASLGELTAVRDELRRSNRDLSNFAQQVSHDLRTPLTGILANAELLAGEPVVQADDDLRVVVDDILLSGRRMNDLIGQVLAYGQEGGRLSVRPTSLREVFHRARADIGRLVAERGAVVELGELPVVPCDPDLVYSVALNLLGNAVKFARPGVAPRVCVSAERSADRVRVRVSDNGIGIPADRVDDVFGLFVRGGSEAEGHGIGLATTARIIEAHGGHVGVEAGDGPGTTVWFELPA
ncbi:sensor histidine kinase [Nocardioides xinjiangensis]|uniref:sensor histidine kinase n=1 Tax=Nocardioides xinjiangensis TaxID=2817376 RepID=UPI001B30275C|nr:MULTISPECIES: GAF domain-containing sensor histidine kinase [unclassified Nocardioides]